MCGKGGLIVAYLVGYNAPNNLPNSLQPAIDSDNGGKGMKKTRERLYGGGRRRESTYLDKETSDRFRAFFCARPWLDTKSKTLEAAIEFYLFYAEKYGLDERHWPRIPIQEVPSEARPVIKQPIDEWAHYSRIAQSYCR